MNSSGAVSNSSVDPLCAQNYLPVFELLCHRLVEANMERVTVKSIVTFFSACSFLQVQGHSLVKRHIEVLIGNYKVKSGLAISIVNAFQINMSSPLCRVLNRFSLQYSTQSDVSYDFSFHIFSNLEEYIISPLLNLDSSHKSLVFDCMKLDCKPAINYSDVLVRRMLNPISSSAHFTRKERFLQLLLEAAEAGCFSSKSTYIPFLIGKLMENLLDHSNNFIFQQFSIIRCSQRILLQLAKSNLLLVSDDQLHKIVVYTVNNLSSEAKDIGGELRSIALSTLFRLILNNKFLFGDNTILLTKAVQSTLNNLDFRELGPVGHAVRSSAKRLLTILIRKNLLSPFPDFPKGFELNESIVPYGISHLKSSHVNLRSMASLLICATVEKQFVAAGSKNLETVFRFIEVNMSSKDLIVLNDVHIIFDCLIKHNLISKDLLHLAIIL